MSFAPPGFGYQNGSKLAPKWDQKSILTWKGDFSKIVLSLQRGLDFSGSGGPSWEQKPIKDRSKSGVQDEMHLGIDFLSMLMEFWKQVGKQNLSKIDPKRHWKEDAKGSGVL